MKILLFLQAFGAVSKALEETKDATPLVFTSLFILLVVIIFIIKNWKKVK